ncbi:hypothetical protein E2C01_093508 [Portunus trituberculatus]|uniref:Uncharacterized protein n=1 Tax=Portunus trituberculatus TaxID=210409 RepID=A0A5B7JUD8_PORTR|nr:hypothetical protein [Portunus trituberculatus]
MAVLMRCAACVALVCYWLAAVCAFNLEPRIPVVKLGSPRSHFGYSARGGYGGGGDGDGDGGGGGSSGEVGAHCYRRRDPSTYSRCHRAIALRAVSRSGTAGRCTRGGEWSRGMVVVMMWGVGHPQHHNHRRLTFTQ